MRTTGTMAAGLTLMLAVAGCSSGSSKVLVQQSQSPPLPGTSSAAAATDAPYRYPTAKPTPTSKPSDTGSTATVGTASSAPATPATPAGKKPTPRPSASATRSTVTTTSACTGTGSTTTIQMATGDQFSPSSVTINRCDSVKAVYADTAGAPHNWQGKGWKSPDMNSPGQSYTFRFTSSGTFNFFCSYHQSLGMTGTVTVH